MSAPQPHHFVPALGTNQSFSSVEAQFALIVAALGLLGLAALTASQRRKEISIRKVLGAGHGTIARLLTGQFAILVVIAEVLAFPTVWFVSDNWLNNFGSRVSMTADIFFFPAIIVLVVSLLASALHVWRLTSSRPVDACGQTKNFMSIFSYSNHVITIVDQAFRRV